MKAAEVDIERIYVSLFMSEDEGLDERVRAARASVDWDLIYALYLSDKYDLVKECLFTHNYHRFREESIYYYHNYLRDTDRCDFYDLVLHRHGVRLDATPGPYAAVHQEVRPCTVAPSRAAVQPPMAPDQA